MILSYSCVIVYTANCVDPHTKSISYIITQETHQLFILSFMGLMFLFTLGYEYIRPEHSKYYIFCLLVGIAGVLYFDESSMFHYLFAFLAFASILLFMNFYKDKDAWLHFLFAIQQNVAKMLLLSFFDDILLPEAFFLLVFAIHYLCVHFKESV